MTDFKKNLDSYLAKIDEVNAKGKYKDNWDSVMHHKVPDWYRNGKFGIFIHWGVYSVPAFGNEWYPRLMYQKDVVRRGNSYFQHHIDTYGHHKDFGYRDFVPMFQAEKFNPQEWADLFVEAGAKFVMPVAEHHDGFAMYDTEFSDWSAVHMGPKKDVVGLLKEEVEKRNMVYTLSSHRVEHYWFMEGGRDFDSDFPEEIPYGDIYWPSKHRKNNNDSFSSIATEADVVDIQDIDQQFKEDWLARTCELVDKYRPKIIFFDWWIQVKPMKPYLKKFMAYYYNRAEEWGEEVTVNYKNDAFIHTSAVKDIERGQLSNISPYFWQNDTSVAKASWCYTEDNVYKTPYDVLTVLIDVVAKNGALLLNIGPKADGTIPEEDAHILREVGKWLKVNGEGIYDTYPWRQHGEGPTEAKEGHFTDTKTAEYTTEDFRFTFNATNLYVFSLKWPEDGIVRIKTLGRKSKKFNAVIEKVEVLGESSPCTWKLCDDYLTVIGDIKETGLPVCIKISTD